MQEFPERVRIFKRNCETVRKLNAVKKEGYKVSLLPFFAFIDARPQVLPRSAFYVHHPCIQALVLAHIAHGLNEDCPIHLNGSTSDKNSRLCCDM